MVVPRLSPPTWAITIELFFYFLIALGLSRNLFVTQTWVVVSVIFIAFSFFTEQPMNYRYATIFAASLPFSIGSLIFHYNTALYSFIKRIRYINIPLVSTCIVLNALVVLLIYAQTNNLIIREIGQYSNLFLGAILLIFLSNYTFKNPKLRRLDKAIGDLSYPLYLIHWPCALLISFIFDINSTGHITLYFLLTLLLSLIICYLCIYLIDKKIEILRDSIRAIKV